LNLRSRRVVSLALALGFIAVLAGHLASQTTTPVPLTVLSKDGRRQLALTLVGDQEFVGVDDLATFFQLTTREDALGALTVSYKGRSIVLTVDQPLASVAGRLVALPAPSTRAGRRWLVPVEFIPRALTLVYDTKLDLRKPSHLLVMGDLRVPRVTVRYDLLSPGARLTIDATPRATSTVGQDSERLTIKFDADALDIANPPLAAPGPQSLVQAVRVLDAVTLTVDLGPRNAGFRATSQPVDTTMRLTIDVAEAAPQVPLPPAAPAAPAPVAPPEAPPALGPAVATIRTVAIDPGHGGMDEGAKGANGTKEKDVTLAVARRVKAALETRLGIRVLLTRDDDRDLLVDDRTAVANNNKADLFISLHLNTSRRAPVAGASIYYAAFDRRAEDTANAAARIERVPVVGGGTRDIELTAWDLAQTRHLDQSRSFATVLEEQLRDHVPLAAKSVDRAPLAVLKSANMPAVLVEMGFLTNADQETAVIGNDFQTTFVQALSDAIVKYRDSLAGAAR